MSQTAGILAPSDEQIALLQAILQEERHMPTSLEEAQEIGAQLVSFYEYLARERKQLEKVKENEQH